MHRDVRMPRAQGCAGAAECTDAPTPRDRSGRPSSNVARISRLVTAARCNAFPRRPDSMRLLFVGGLLLASQFAAAQSFVLRPTCAPYECGASVYGAGASRPIGSL